MKENFYRKTTVLIFITILCQFVNLIRDMLLVRFFGASSINDVYLVSQTIVSVIITMINSPMAVAYVPITTKYYIEKTKQERNEFVSKVYSNILIISFILVLFEIFAVDLIVKLSAPGFDYNLCEMLKKLIILQTPITFVNLIKGVNRGNFQILQKFNISEISSVFPYVCMCVFLLLPSEKNIYEITSVLSIGTCISIIPEFIILFRNGFRFRFSPGINIDIKIMLGLMAAAAITSGIREVNVLFDKAIGSMLPAGSITMLSYASKLTVVVVGLITTSISIVGFVNIAKLRVNKQLDKICEGIVSSCNLINFIVIPISVYLSIFSFDIIKLLYYGGDFDMQNVKQTANLMKIYAIGLVGYGFQDVYTRTLHAYKIVRCTIKASTIMVGINIILNILLYKSCGVYGIAAATSIAVLSVVPILGKDVEICIGNYNKKHVIFEMIKLLVISSIIGGLIIIIQIFLKNNSFVLFVIESFIFFLLYFFFCLLIKNNVLHEFIKEIRN